MEFHALVIHPPGSRSGFQVPEDHEAKVLGSKIRLDAMGSGGSYGIDRLVDSPDGKRHVYLNGLWDLRWAVGPGNPPYGYPFPGDRRG